MLFRNPRQIEARPQRRPVIGDRIQQAEIFMVEAAYVI
jgi:hypothetical protein